MNLWIKRVGLALGAFLLLVSLVAVYFVSTFDATHYKSIAIDWMKTERQRTLAIDGPVDLSVFPRLAVKVSKLHLSERGRGDEFATEDMANAMRELLLPQTTILTPNSVEARRLAESDDDEELSLDACAERLVEMGAGYVLITGTHEATPQVVNTLYGKGGIVRTDSWQRLPGTFHGSGCTLASAIAAMLANGLDLADAVREAQEYTWQTLQKAYRPGMGHFLPDRLFWAREDAEAPAEAAAAPRATDARSSH